MSEHKFTPGPWRVREVTKYHADDEHTTLEAIEVWSADELVSADVSNHANARLIAAAPEMLEAAKDALAGWRYIREHHGDLYGVGWDRVEQALNAAITKATGGSHDKE